MSLALPSALLWNAAGRLGDGQRIILCQRVPGSVRAVRAIQNTWVFQTKPRVVAEIYMVYYGRGQHVVRVLGDFAGYKSSIINWISILTIW
jgi:hypothetical protein